jgi:hypothetical protein
VKSTRNRSSHHAECSESPKQSRVKGRWSNYVVLTLQFSMAAIKKSKTSRPRHPAPIGNHVHAKEDKDLAKRTWRLHEQASRSLLAVHEKVYVSTTTSPPAAAALPQLCAATTRHPAAQALRQPCRASRVLVSRPQRLYIDYAAAATSSSGRTTTSTSLN